MEAQSPLMEILSLRKIGGSLYFRLPNYYKYKFNLNPGDVYQIIPNRDGTILKIVKAEEETEQQADGRTREAMDAA
jgi:antitoxin component of MazEF toxin-antitoxin module